MLGMNMIDEFSRGGGSDSSCLLLSINMVGQCSNNTTWMGW